MAQCAYHDQLISIRRELHQFPEEGWTEFCTTAFIVEHLRKLGYEVLMGEKVVSRKDCLGRDPKLVAQAIETAKDLARREGLMCGISSGTNVAAALKMAKKLGKGKTVLTILPDTAERYFSTPLFGEE